MKNNRWEIKWETVIGFIFIVIAFFACCGSIRSGNLSGLVPSALSLFMGLVFLDFGRPAVSLFRKWRKKRNRREVLRLKIELRVERARNTFLDACNTLTKTRARNWQKFMYDQRSSLTHFLRDDYDGKTLLPPNFEAEVAAKKRRKK